MESTYNRVSTEQVKLIKELLAEKKLSQRKIANIAGTSRATVSRIVRGIHATGNPRSTKKDPWKWTKLYVAKRCPHCRVMVIELAMAVDTPCCRACFIRNGYHKIELEENQEQE